MDKPVLALTYEHIDRWIASIQSRLIKEEFVCVIGILRGGAPLALMVSHAAGIPVTFLRYDRGQRLAVWDSALPVPTPGSKVLLCEDISGVGHTLSDCLGYLEILGARIKTLTAGFDDKSVITPDYSIDGRGYTLVFPWERQAYTLNYRKHWDETGGGRTAAMAPDHQYDAYAIDLDGVLLRDIDPGAYRADLERALDERDALPAFKKAPLKQSVKAIITGRPHMDRQRTQAWLDKNGFGGIELVMRDPSAHDDSPSQVASHKADAAVRMACTHFVESNPVQAVYIASAAPLLRVIWWDASVSQATLIGASDCEEFSLHGPG
ncbi:phosphoribosyltransferase [Pseudomonas sp. RC10]|uniref:phosphoribosyltransferase n=1 Tax=Pseudomonas bambusae TaxID=3139142 RepID=UPI0031392683